MEMIEEVRKLIHESISAKSDFLAESRNIENAARIIIQCIKNENKILVFGNGGSAADAQHIAGELIGRFKMERKSLPAIALTTDSSVITSLSNDYEYAMIFERQVEGLAKKGDILIGISTSGNSENVIRALKKGRELGTFNITLTGNNGGIIKGISDVNINSSSKNTPRIQECHILAYHIICELVEKELFGQQSVKV